MVNRAFVGYKLANKNMVLLDYFRKDKINATYFSRANQYVERFRI